MILKTNLLERGKLFQYMQREKCFMFNNHFFVNFGQPISGQDIYCNYQRGRNHVISFQSQKSRLRQMMRPSGSLGARCIAILCLDTYVLRLAV